MKTRNMKFKKKKGEKKGLYDEREKYSKLKEELEENKYKNK
jgi:hypothetical protein